MGSPFVPAKPTVAPQQPATAVVDNPRRIRRPVGICQNRACQKPGRRFSRKQPHQRFCSPGCRNAAWLKVHRLVLCPSARIDWPVLTVPEP